MDLYSLVVHFFPIDMNQHLSCLLNVCCELLSVGTRCFKNRIQLVFCFKNLESLIKNLALAVFRVKVMYRKVS